MKNFIFFCLKIFNIENWNFVCECSLWHHFSDINFMPFFSHCIFVLFQLLRSFYVCLLHIALCQIEAGIVSDAAGGNWKQFFFSDGKINFRCWPTNRIILCLCVYINLVANHLRETTNYTQKITYLHHEQALVKNNEIMPCNNSVWH